MSKDTDRQIEQSAKQMLVIQRAKGTTLSALYQKAVEVYEAKPQLGLCFFRQLAQDLEHQCLQIKGQQLTVKKRIFTSTSAIYLAKKSRSDDDEYTKLAKIYYNLSESVPTPARQQSVLLRSSILFYTGQLGEGVDLLKNNILCYENQAIMGNFLLLAQIYFAKRQYQKALEELKKCLMIFKDLPLNGRLAMAYCYYNLNKFELAEACFKRIVQIDPKCIQALVGLAVICERNEEHQNYFAYIKACLKVDREHPLVIMHEAEHYLLLRNNVKVRSLAERGLRRIRSMARVYDCSQVLRNDYYQFEGRFLNLIGQSYHMEGNFKAALIYYRQLKNRKLVCMSWNAIQEIQCFTALNDYKDAIWAMEAHLNTSNHQGQLNKDSRLSGDVYRLLAYLRAKGATSSQHLALAEMYYNEALRFNKRDCFLKFQFIHFLTSNGELAKAKDVYRNLLDDFMAQGYEVSPQMHNNLGAILIELGEFSEATLHLNKALGLVRSQCIREVDGKGIQIAVMYNIAICSELSHCYFSAIATYLQIIDKNKLFIDAYLRAAHCYRQLGNQQQSLTVLQEALKFATTQYQIIFPSKIHLLQAYFLFEDGSYNQAGSTLELIPEQTLYKRVFRICVEYHQLLQCEDIQQQIRGLRERRNECESLCRQDPSSAFAAFLYWIVTLTLRSKDKEIYAKIHLPDYKVYEALQALQQSQDDHHAFPIAFSKGIYSMGIGRLDSAVAIFKQCSWSADTQASTLTACCQLMGGQLPSSIKTTKLNVLLDPSDVKQRYRLQYLMLKRSKLQYSLQTSDAHSKRQNYLASMEIVQCERIMRQIFLSDLQHFSKYGGTHQQHLRQTKSLLQMKQHLAQLAPLATECMNKYSRIRRQAQREDQKELALSFIKVTNRRMSARQSLIEPEAGCQQAGLKRPLRAQSNKLEEDKPTKRSKDSRQIKKIDVVSKKSVEVVELESGQPKKTKEVRRLIDQQSQTDKLKF